jgi:GntR family transcriptional regulator
MLLRLSDRSTEPLHSQISRQLRARVLAGELNEGDMLPSIRAFARDHRVSVITVQRAYEDLEKEGLLHTRRGKGFFVSRLTDRRRGDLARRRFEEAVAPVIEGALAEGLGASEVKKIVDDILKKKGDVR